MIVYKVPVEIVYYPTLPFKHVWVWDDGTIHVERQYAADRSEK